MTVHKAALPKSFEELIVQSPIPVLVDFWAEWCGPCKILSPVVEQLAREFKGRILTVKINVDEKPHIAGKYGIRSIPALLLFYRGRVLMQSVGAKPFEQLRQGLTAHLAAQEAPY